MSNRFKVLIIEDEINICNFVKTVLEANGYQVVFAQSAATGKTMFLSHRPDLLILDLGLPDLDGTEIIKQIRESAGTPIIVLSARTNESDKVKALDLGADDYITKPFGTNELLARVRAALRGYRRREAESDMPNDKFCVADLVIDYAYRRVTIQNSEIKLTQTEYNVLELLSMHAGKVMTYSEINKKVWGYSDSGSVKKLQVNMANIRKKLGEKPGENRYIANELGIGYRMNIDSE